MKEKWISPKIIIGKDATGDYYYSRNEIENEIWSELKKGNNLLLSAPRRVGKTSVMKFLTQKPEKGFKLIFENVQAIHTEELFYKRLYVLILNCLNKSTVYTRKFQDYFKSLGITEISMDSLKFEHKEIDYIAEINKIIPKLDEEGETIVLLIDELPEVLHTLHKSGKSESASSILKKLRYWRQEESFKKLQFVIAGSIGIHHIVQLVDGRTSDINDIKSIHYPALLTDSDEFEKYIKWALDKASISFQEGAVSYLKYKIQYLVPYFINLMLDEIDKAAMKNQEAVITDKEVDEAFEKIVKNNTYFVDWKKRLKDYLKSNHFKFVNHVLIHIAHKETISIQQIYNIAVQYKETEDYMDLIYDLTQDGYIMEKEQEYTFISPFLKAYWKRSNPIFND